MTGGEIMAVVGFIVMLFGAMFGIWKYIDGKISAVRRDADSKSEAAAALATLARQELAEHKLHTAQTYATKAGMQEQTNSLLRAIESLGSRIDGIAERIDNIILQRPQRRS